MVRDVVKMKDIQFEKGLFENWMSGKIMEELLCSYKELPKGGTHLTAFRKAITKVMSDYFKIKLSVSETCKGIVCAFNVNLSNPYFTGACKFELYSKHMWEYDDGNAGPSIYNSIKDFLSSMLPELLAGNNSLSNIIKSRSENVWEQSE